MRDIPTVNPDDVEDDEYNISKMDDISKKEAIHLLRSINIYRLKGVVDEFINFVINVKDIMEKYEKDEPIPKFIMQNRETYELFHYLVDYTFQEYDNAKYFADEPELADHIIGDVSHLYRIEQDPSNVKKLVDLTRHDAIHLLRIFNSFRKSYTVDQFFTQMGDVENVYDTFSNFVGYIFGEYGNANYFKNEPELIDPVFQEKEFGKVIESEGKYDSS